MAKCDGLKKTDIRSVEKMRSHWKVWAPHDVSKFSVKYDIFESLMDDYEDQLETDYVDFSNGVLEFDTIESSSDDELWIVIGGVML